MLGSDDGEVSAVERRDGAGIQPLSSCDDRRVDRTEREIAVMRYQLRDAQPIGRSSSHRSRPAFAAPLAPVDLNHALAVVGAFALVFAVIAVTRTIRPDVLE